MLEITVPQDAQILLVVLAPEERAPSSVQHGTFIDLISVAESTVSVKEIWHRNSFW